VVRKVSTLKGVAGTLICTLDGLLVAAQFPTPVGEEAVAAMIPQVFGKLVTCSKELRFGTPSRMHFAVEGTQYQVFRTGRVYLTLASDPGEALPMPELMAVAEMLAKQSR
jgi:predicted regulator of Ras-like GTPase activity (Roadblock/LC7/MglB family)